MADAIARTPRRLERVQRRWRAGVFQIASGLAGFVLGVALSAIRVGPMVPADRAASTLTSFGFGIISLISILFSLLFLVAQWVFGSLSPRLTMFIDDPYLWRTFGASIGVFVFSVTATICVASQPRVSVFVPLVDLAAVLVVIMMMRSLQLHAFAAVQLGSTLTTVVTRGSELFKELYPAGLDDLGVDSAAIPALPKLGLRRPAVWVGAPGVLQQIDVETLVRAAARAEAVIAMKARLGQTMYEGTVIAEVDGTNPQAVNDLVGVLPKALVTGDHRTFCQDPTLALRLSADIGLRALSPAVNDPATAVQALDAALALLRQIADKQLDIGQVRDTAGYLRLVLPVPDWEAYLRIGLDDFIEATARAPMVLRRLVAGLEELIPGVPASRMQGVRRRLDRAAELLKQGFPHLEA